ncbi:ubiquitin-specific protease UBP14 [Lachancea thermotolerans CBS 6340]|uniref:Ubiquitin carboxyl-terminal hydrolase n=1 Tax=Lachancea thermotolerans (strain ATCC 56472 / CBS 6340 / NRRL Y-8284) TaxID=559295 RepID=C5DE95_LACTC|nr:KLTH0C07326p [Lachancea thermotolerans CBS 6340]CAR22106.1 KLTH0C07326p [Lachancea thermotolerans CBS 6340]
MSELEEFGLLQIPSVIHKDDCGYCFESMYNDDQMASHALNVCLTCFQSFCDTHIPVHQSVAKNDFNDKHDFLLKVSKIRKPEQKQPIEKKLKLEITEKSEDDTYESLWWLTKGAVIIADYRTQGLNSSVTTKVTEILNARSSNFQNMTQAWQLEVKPCVHVENLEVPNDNPQTVANRCTDCKLGSNLWMCLHCGNVGCGRQQVGIEGHSHALKHFESNPGHPLAVKLGSLSNSAADIYCYSCDDEVQFADTKKWIQLLLYWGIDIQSRVAQEKTLLELQVEQNMNWDFQMVDAEGHELRHLEGSKKYGYGLQNLGNSCYLNSVLQVLLNGDLSRWSLEGLGDFPGDVLYVSSNLRCQLIKMRNALKNEPEKYPHGVKPTTFKHCIGGTHEEFSSGRQQDALEFFSYFVDLLDKKVFEKSSSNPNDLMKFSLQDRIECTKCHGVKYTSQVSDYLQVLLSDSEEPQDLLANLAQNFQGDEVEFKCPTCNETTKANKSCGFRTFPEILVASCSRIKLVNWVPVKTSQEVLVPGTQAADTAILELGQFKSNGFDPDNETLLEKGEPAGFEPKANCIIQLTEMGFSENAAVRALYHSGNSSAEVAANWLFQHMDDADLNDPFIVPSAPSKAAEVNPQALENMAAMGLNPELCRKALIINQGNVSASVEWVFNNLDYCDSSIQESTVDEDDKEYGITDKDKANYRLKAVVCHKGASVHSGHYVAFIKKQVENEVKWVLYNDEKIVVADSPTNIEEIKKNGYIYFFDRS